MTPVDILSLTRDALLVIIWVSLPVVVVATLTALGVATLQTVTQIQDQSIGQSLRQVAVMVTIVLTTGWSGRQVMGFAERAFHVVSQLP
ncbi:EscS/YscS/HrcS family type III secretion system export apparatus protein [Rhizobacter sp. Root1221]|jgi:type III secretion protein S|uniref:EscS/YscS/HrcS family type III secretion system export apparatus protein n=1 Tax=Rhizobacter sp. Root1221 TaxID=1736433 RepID=UPI000701B952|nr:flagellar biosynthetic protein FliQ [Rhizobacter sp. Root1221]KQW02664.1 type III secretion protein HrpO [Rhizobacter sp. Root1221]